jgi:hypothetical protein
VKSSILTVSLGFLCPRKLGKVGKNEVFGGWVGTKKAKFSGTPYSAIEVQCIRQDNTKDFEGKMVRRNTTARLLTGIIQVFLATLPAIGTKWAQWTMLLISKALLFLGDQDQV